MERLDKVPNTGSTTLAFRNTAYYSYCKTHSSCRTNPSLSHHTCPVSGSLFYTPFRTLQVMRYGTDFSTQIKTCLPASTRAGLFFRPMQSHMKAAHFLWMVGGSGGVVAKSGLSLVTHGLQPASLLWPWDSPAGLSVKSFLKSHPVQFNYLPRKTSHFLLVSLGFYQYGHT